MYFKWTRFSSSSSSFPAISTTNIIIKIKESITYLMVGRRRTRISLHDGLQGRRATTDTGYVYTPWGRVGNLSYNPGSNIIKL